MFSGLRAPDAVWAEKYPPQKPGFLERQDNVGYGHSPVMALMCRVFLLQQCHAL